MTENNRLRESMLVTPLMEKMRAAGFFATRIESHSTTVGIPDIVYTHHGVCSWIECKYINKSSVDTITVPFRGGQQAWAMQHYKAGGFPVILAVLFANGMIGTVPLTRVWPDCKIDKERLTLHDTAYNTVAELSQELARYGRIIHKGVMV